MFLQLAAPLKAHITITLKDRLFSTRLFYTVSKMFWLAVKLPNLRTQVEVSEKRGLCFPCWYVSADPCISLVITAYFALRVLESIPAVLPWTSRHHPHSHLQPI